MELAGGKSISTSGYRAFVKVLVVGLALVALCEPIVVVSGASVSPSQCGEERKQGIAVCKAVIFGQAPSAACCRLIRVGHFECVCPVMDPKLAAIITVNRAVKLLKDCGRVVPRNFQCGSLHFP